MTKFEEEVKRPDNGPITELNNSMHSVLSQYRKMREYADYLEYELKQKDEHILKLENENSFMRDECTTFDSNGMAVEPKLQQQALPVVPECVGEFVSGDETELSKADRIAYLLKSVEGDNYYLEEYLTNAGIISQEQGEHLYAWATNQTHETILELWNGYQVEKPQLFYLKNKLTGLWLMRYEIVDKVYPYDHTSDIRNRDTFTQQEIDSMQTGSYELVPVED